MEVVRDGGVADTGIADVVVAPSSPMLPSPGARRHCKVTADQVIIDSVITDQVITDPVVTPRSGVVVVSTRPRARRRASRRSQGRQRDCWE